jgi:phosphoglycolate phosphatase-like HAD superfamily hydrolase
MDSAYETVRNLRAIFGYETGPREETLAILSELTQKEAVITFSPEEVKSDRDYLEFALRYARRIHQIFRDRMANAFPGSIECLRELKLTGFYLGLVTNNSKEAVMRYFDKYDAHDLFDTYVSGDSGLSKAEAIRSILTRSGFEARECLFVGDTARDMRESRQAGVCAAGVLCGAHRLQRLSAEDPFAILSTVSDLPMLIEQTQELAMA